MEKTVREAFSVLPSGCVGQIILDPDGQTLAWTTDAWTAQVICQLLNENPDLLQGRSKHENQEAADEPEGAAK